MADNTLMDKLSSMPKWLLVTGGVLLVSLLGYGMFYLAFGMNKKPDMVDASTITLDMPDAAGNGYDKSRLDSYREGDYLANSGRNPVDDYWNSLGGDLVSGGGDLSSPGSDDMSFLNSGEYSEAEKKMILGGVKTREEIDAEHARKRAFEQFSSGSSGSQAGGGVSSRPLTQAQKDSVYMARMEKAYEMAMRYQNPGVPASPSPEPQAEERQIEEEEEKERQLDLQKELPMDSFTGDGIISSLDNSGDNGSVDTRGGASRRPIKATFLKNEKISNGERVIIRLMQDLTLSDGTVIPTNTHITGTCNFGKRLRINVKTLHYAGRMFPTDLSVYDNDGTEGIYCPLAEASEKKSKKLKEVAGGVVSAVGSTAGTLLTGNPFIGRVATTGLSGITSSFNQDGSVSVNITAGYEFYIYENIKEEKKYGSR